MSQRSTTAVSNTLAVLRDSADQMIKHAIAELFQEIHSSTDECGTLFCSENCPHVLEAAARHVLRLWYDRATQGAQSHDQLFDSGRNHIDGFTFVHRSQVMKTALGEMSVLVRDSSHNAVETFNPPKGKKDNTKVAAANADVEKVTESNGRDIGKYFETWLLDETIPKLGPEAIERVNSALAATFFAEPFSVTMIGLPASEKSTRAAFDTRLTFEVTDRSGNSMSFTDVVNVKYESASSTSPGNSGGARMLAVAMLGPTSTTSKEEHLTQEINKSLNVDDTYTVEDSDYWFWCFKREDNAPPVTEFHVTSLLTIDPDAESAVTRTAEGENARAIRLNGQQSFPCLQVKYASGERRTRFAGTALEARDRLWNWYMPKYQERLVTVLEASKNGF